MTRSGEPHPHPTDKTSRRRLIDVADDYRNTVLAISGLGVIVSLYLANTTDWPMWAKATLQVVAALLGAVFGGYVQRDKTRAMLGSHVSGATLQLLDHLSSLRDVALHLQSDRLTLEEKKANGSSSHSISETLLTIRGTERAMRAILRAAESAIEFWAIIDRQSSESAVAQYKKRDDIRPDHEATVTDTGERR